MRTLSIEHSSITRESLLKMAGEIPGAWVGIRIAAYLLLLSGWKTSQVAELFGLTRWAVVKWIYKANEDGVKAVEDRIRSGRPSQFDKGLMKEIDKVLSKSPKEVGIQRVRWDGVVLAEHIKRFYQIKITVRHAQGIILKLGYSLRQPIYRFVQASKEGVKEFGEELKKTSIGSKKRREKGYTF